LDDKVRLTKYYYKSMFNNGADKEMVKKGFDGKYIKFIDTVMELTNDNIFNQIKEYNKWNCVIPTIDEFNKVKLNEQLLEKIFKQFHFRNITNKSNAKNIMKSIYKSYFSKDIIMTETKDNKNYKHHINEDVLMMYNFVINNCCKKQSSNYDTKLLDYINNKDICFDEDEYDE